jgi:hypothetical protein
VKPHDILFSAAILGVVFLVGFAVFRVAAG